MLIHNSLPFRKMFIYKTNVLATKVSFLLSCKTCCTEYANILHGKYIKWINWQSRRIVFILYYHTQCIYVFNMPYKRDRGCIFMRFISEIRLSLHENHERKQSSMCWYSHNRKSGIIMHVYSCHVRVGDFFSIVYWEIDSRYVLNFNNS